MNTFTRVIVALLLGAGGFGLQTTACLAGPEGAPAPSASEKENGFVPIFNGQDLMGWDGRILKWCVQDGAIMAQSVPERPCKKHHYRIWTGGRPGDFVLRLHANVTVNSGVMIRLEMSPSTSG